MRKFIVFAFIFICFFALSIYWYYSPEHLVQTPNHIAYFFDMPSKSIKGFKVYDMIRNQGEDCFDFGSDYYWLSIENPQIAGKAILDAGGTETDSIWSITRRRGDFIGIFQVAKEGNRGSLYYEKNKL